MKFLQSDNPIYKKGRYLVYPSGYKVDRYIIRGAMIIMFLFLFSIFVRMRFDFSHKFYFECNDVMGCKNPFYWQDDLRCSSYEWCYDPYVTQGIHGEKPTRLVRSFLPIVLGLFALAFVINHKINNKGFKIRRGEWIRSQ